MHTLGACGRHAIINHSILSNDPNAVGIFVVNYI